MVSIILPYSLLCGFGFEIENLWTEYTVLVPGWGYVKCSDQNYVHIPNESKICTYSLWHKVISIASDWTLNILEWHTWLNDKYLTFVGDVG